MEDLEQFSKFAYLSKNGYVLKKEYLPDEELEFLKKNLWGKPLQDDRYSMFNKTTNSFFKVYTETKNKIYIPKIYGIKRYGFPKTYLKSYTGSSWNHNIEFTGKLYESQIEPVEILVNELVNGKTGGILSLETGGGKSISALCALSKLKYKTIIIVNKISLLKQWESEIKSFLPNAEVGILQGQKNIDIENKDIIIAMLQSLARINYPESFFENIGVTVADEVHNLSSKVFSQVLMKLSSKYTIGLSATPQRSDGCEYIFQWFIGDVVYKSNSERKGLHPIVNLVKIDSTDYKEIVTQNKITGQNQIQFTSMLSDLILMPKRNKLIVEIIKHYIIQENRKILVLSDRRSHLKIIKKALDSDINTTFTYGLFLGQMKIQELEKSKSCQVILATYQAFGEGVSEKDLDTLLLITPKKFIGHLKTTKNESGKLEQIVGRIFRKEHVLKHPLIIDIQDNFSIYKNHARQRNAFYKQHFKLVSFTEQSINFDKHDLDDNITINSLLLKNKNRNNNDKYTELAELDNLNQKLYNQCLLD